MLTTLKIKSAAPSQRAYKLADGGGLFVLVQPSGSKLWRYKFRINGVEGLHTLGAFPEVSLADARGEHAQARKLVAQGVHPGVARKQEKAELALADLQREKGSFEAVVADWKATTASSLRPATVKQRNREIANDLLPRFRRRAIQTITRLELTTALKAVESRGAPEVARNLRNYLWGIFEYAIDTGLIEDNPVPPVRILRKRNQSNHPALSPERLGAFLRAVDALPKTSEQTRGAMGLIVLTVCRKVEVIGARWSEFDLKAAEWEVPGERMKGKRPHWVPLSRQAVALLKKLRALAPSESGLLFPNRDDPTRPMAGRSVNAVMERLGFLGDGSPHGMRASFSTHFNSLSENLDVIERCLAHVPKDKVRRAYNRHEYKKERSVLLQAWADHVDLLRATTPSQPSVNKKSDAPTRTSRRPVRAVPKRRMAAGADG
jgi:integrase